jgi:uncharacterized protein Usg
VKYQITGRGIATMSDRDFLSQLQGHSLTTAEILYRMPDQPALIQSYLWQEYDIAPAFPKLINFLNFWTESLDGPLYRIQVAHRQLVRPAEIRFLDGEFRLN